MNQRFVFLVLHYLSDEDTVACVESILLNIVADDLHIVIVDNASPNGSGRALKERYSHNGSVHVILNQKNEGFARGNNVGFEFAKKELRPDYIIMLNNDTIIRQRDFCRCIHDIYSNQPFAVLGPKIISLVDGENQNPVPYALYNKWRVLRRLVMFCILYLFSFLGLDTKLSRAKKNINNGKLHQNFQLHGSCLIFSRDYISKFDGLYPGTFMYSEEDILKYICDRFQLNISYSDRIEIFHKEGASTKRAAGKDLNKRRFYYYNTVKSLTKLLSLMLGIEKIDLGKR